MAPKPKKQKVAHRGASSAITSTHNNEDRYDNQEEAEQETEPISSSTSSTTSTRVPVSVSSLSLPSTSLTSSSSSSPSLSAPSSKSSSSKLIIVLLRSSLETIKTRDGYELISGDTHKNLLLKLNKDPSLYRPDITHQCLLTLLDSPLNKAGLLQIFIQTEKNVLIEVNSSIRIPRTFKRFAGLIVQLLHKLKIRASDSPAYLLRIIKNPITDHLPSGALKLGTSVKGTLVNMTELAVAIGGGKPKGAGLVSPIVITCGAHASGPASVDWTEKTISISQYPLSASVALGRIMNSFENAWGIL